VRARSGHAESRLPRARTTVVVLSAWDRRESPAGVGRREGTIFASSTDGEVVGRCPVGSGRLAAFPVAEELVGSVGGRGGERGVERKVRVDAAVLPLEEFPLSCRMKKLIRWVLLKVGTSKKEVGRS